MALGEEQQQAFMTLKAQLVSSSLLAHYDLKVQLALSCDASLYEVGAVLLHCFDDKTE